ncbi:MFS multidrug transporter [Auriculariales sp. MPI-PUGE-AT-0066]|nr:MFS multidrug transporter [Auriculariales sp. MPI-PUGE-AT-0066]
MSDDQIPTTRTVRRSASFYLLFLALCVSLYLASFEIESILECAAVSLALPTIAADLKSSEFSWVGAGYSLAASAAIPLSGGLCETFGRRAIMLLSLVISICGAATSMNMLIAGRCIQGVGGGGILSLPSIVLSDMVSLRERGLYNGLLGVAVAIVLVLLFMHTPVPPGKVIDKLKKLDWISSLVCLALAWAGVEHPWSSGAVLAPLLISLSGLVGFVVFEVKFAKEPLIPFRLLAERTATIGYLDYAYSSISTTFLNSVLAVPCLFFLPAYLQGRKLDSPIRAGGLHSLGLSLTVGPAGIIAGISVRVFKIYRPQMWTAWLFVFLGFGLLTTCTKDTSTSLINLYEFLGAVGTGMLFTTTYFPVLAPLPVSANARALAFFNFCRSFGQSMQVWGIAIGATNELLHRLPEEFTAVLPTGIQVAYAVIPQIKTLPEPLQSAVRTAFAESVATIWKVYERDSNAHRG